jgi:hypothetical protein
MKTEAFTAKPIFQRVIFRGQALCVSKRDITYFQPIIPPQQQQNMSATVCIPESIILSSNTPTVMFTLKTQAP